jgi:hypothetical protein
MVSEDSMSRVIVLLVSGLRRFASCYEGGRRDGLKSATVLELVAFKDLMLLVGWDTVILNLLFTLLMVSEDSTSRVIVLLMSVLTKIGRGRRPDGVDSFWKVL